MTFLLSVTLKITLLTFCALVAATLLRRRSAAVRHWVLATALVGCVCLPPMELLLPAWSIPLSGGWFDSTVDSPLTFVSEPTVSPAAPGPSRDVATASRVPRVPLAAVLASLWIAGAAAGIGVLIAGLVRLRKLAADSEPVSSGTWRQVADEVSRGYGVRRPVRLLCCHHPTMLATWGMVRPTILLPEGAQAWAEDRVDAVLHHELAHVVRGDWVVALTANLLRAVYWFNPLLWMACRRLQHESERACDDLVLTSGITGSEYATHLLDVARESAQRRHAWSPAIAIAHRSMLEGRIRAMLNARVNREPLTVFARATTVAVLAAVTVSIAVVSLSGNTETPAAPHVRLQSSGPLPVLPAPSRGPLVEPRPERAATPAAQVQTGGTVEGVLYDQFGGLLPGASVTLTDMGTGSSHSASTDRGGSFAFRDLAAGNYELVTNLPGFITVKNVIRAESGASVRRHITLPIGTVEETIAVTCSSSDPTASRPTAPTASVTPGAAQRQAASGSRGAEPKIPSTFTGGIGGQIKVPHKLVHVSPICPSPATADSAIVRLSGRIGIDGLFTDLHDVSTDAQPAYVASALEAARQWVFTPTLLNGAPIEVNISVTVDYRRTN